MVAKYEQKRLKGIKQAEDAVVNLSMWQHAVIIAEKASNKDTDTVDTPETEAYDEKKIEEGTDEIVYNSHRAAMRIYRERQRLKQERRREQRERRSFPSTPDDASKENATIVKRLIVTIMLTLPPNNIYDDDTNTLVILVSELIKEIADHMKYEIIGNPSTEDPAGLVPKKSGDLRQSMWDSLNVSVNASQPLKDGFVQLYVSEDTKYGRHFDENTKVAHHGGIEKRSRDKDLYHPNAVAEFMDAVVNASKDYARRRFFRMISGDEFLQNHLEIDI